MGKSAQVFVSGKNGIGPCSRAGHGRKRSSGPFKERLGYLATAPVPASIHDSSESPKGPPVRILRSRPFQPLAAVVHEIAETARRWVIGVENKAEVAALKKG